MNILQTIVGHHLSNLFVDNVAFNVAKLLEESEEEQAANAKRKMFYETLTHYEHKGKKPTFEKCKAIFQRIAGCDKESFSTLSIDESFDCCVLILVKGVFA